MGLQSWVLRALRFEASGLIGLAGWVLGLVFGGWSSG